MTREPQRGTRARLRVLVVICARSGSVGLRHKNLRKVQGTPLLVRAIELARASARPSEHWDVVVSTDSAHYARLARSAGARVPGLRPKALATHRARWIDAVLHTVNLMDTPENSYHVVLGLSATTPLTLPRDIRAGLRLWKKSPHLSVAAVGPDPAAPSWRFALHRGRLTRAPNDRHVGRRQEGAGHVVLNGAFYWASPRWLRAHRQFVLPGKTLALVMPPERCLDIDTPRDLALANWLLASQTG